MDVKTPKTSVKKKKVTIKDENTFKKDLIAFVNDLENKDFFNAPIYDRLVKYGINKKIFDQMVERIRVFSSYDDDETNINFPYEDWIPRLLEIYSEEIK